MMRLTLLLAAACVSTATSTSAMERSRHESPLARHWYHPCDNPNAALAQGPYVGYKPCEDPNAVFVGGTYSGSDPDPNIRAALAREFGRY
jgi:hypothetical protein